MQNIERKYRKPVNENGWMRRIQKWTWGKSAPKFVGYCPFFWFTWLTLLLSPITLILKLVAWLFLAAWRIIIAGAPASIWIRKPSDDSLVEYYECRKWGGIDVQDVLDVSVLKEIHAWIAITPDWENCVKRIIAKRAKKAAREAVRQPKRSAFTNRLARYSSFIVKPILAAIVVVAAYFMLPLLYAGVQQLWIFILGISLAGLIFAAKITGGAIAGTLMLWAIFAVVSRIIAGFRRCPKCPDEMTILYRIGSILSAGIELVEDTIKMLYTRECPLIEWGDHNEPIQTRK